MFTSAWRHQKHHWPALSTVAASCPFFFATTYLPLAARTHTRPSRHSSSKKLLVDLWRTQTQWGDCEGWVCVWTKVCVWLYIQMWCVCVFEVTWRRRYTAVLHLPSVSSIFQQRFWRHTSCPHGSSPSGRLPGPLPRSDWLTGPCLEKVGQSTVNFHLSPEVFPACLKLSYPLIHEVPQIDS